MNCWLYLARRTRCTFALVGIVLLSLPAAAAQEGIQPLPPDGTHYGMKLTDWAVAWIEWTWTIPRSSNPDMSLDSTGTRGGVGQHGPVWFLPGFLGGGRAVRTYVIPAGKAILLHLGAAAVLDAPGARNEDQILADLESVFPDDAGIPPVSLNGTPLSIDPNRYLVTTPVFSVVLAPSNTFGVPVSAGRDPRLVAAAKGFWVLFPPLPIGKHVLVCGDWKYNITIQKPNEPLP